MNAPPLHVAESFAATIHDNSLIDTLGEVNFA